MSPEELEKILSPTFLESNQVEKSSSFDDIAKYSEAICAFSNNFSNNQGDSYLILGVDDKTGKPSTESHVTDEILRRLGELRDNGTIIPRPIILIEKETYQNRDIVVITVKPHPLPPVRYKGLIWIRNGARKARANEAEERILSEKRISFAKNFDAEPCKESSLDDLDINLFKSSYLPNAIDSETLQINHRDIKVQLSSLRFYDLKNDCPTNAGLITLCENAKFYLPGAYIQYIRYEGDNESTEIKNEKSFTGALITVMQELDLYIKNIIESKPVYISNLKEETLFSYPIKALRELINNAIMHRDYQSNAPIKFYEFNNRIEISNPGGLYGSAIHNFPHQNDYRNPVIAEVLKNLGYVNKFNRGIITVQEELRKNSSKAAEFETNIPTQFIVKIMRKSL